jgi:hypothetical protein
VAPFHAEGQQWLDKQFSHCITQTDFWFLQLSFKGPSGLHWVHPDNQELEYLPILRWAD